MGERFTVQAEEIHAICQRTGMDLAELAEHSGLKFDTLRKYAGGYQKASEGTMQNLRRVEQMHTLIKESAAPVTRESSPFKYVGTETLEQNVIDLIHRLRKSAANERKHIIGNLVDAIAEIEHREITGSTPAKPEGGVSPMILEAKHHGDAGGKPADEPPPPKYPPIKKVASRSGSTTAPKHVSGKH